MLTAGVDLAAETRGTALAVVEWSATSARLRSLETAVPDARIVAVAEDAVSTGIDCAFGWPDEFTVFVAAHARGERIDGDLTGMPWRRTLAYRETDRVTREVTGRWPLSVSTDRLGLTAMHCAALLQSIGDRLGPVDRSGAGRVAEVYPGASLRLWGFDTRGYKTDPGVRARLLGEIGERMPWLDLGASADMMAADDDAFDAVVAALVARAHALGLTPPPPPEQVERARREGWIALPPRGLDTIAPRPAP
ncbi:DUF429 domain-containing protein [Herbiconiux sp. CPCC 205716]|uniref:DUF429 domain-containing protein n=1 Tax=Herbiconiux gentiana TaxID=2970912 RepID=A0ABT2GB75_9MICO|nr:DUF429 domain-containing protein [Herbiconiux gentiana]MCS5713443.1 DUF429 domain-containing protein [Herbiconiux gentiana]